MWFRSVMCGYILIIGYRQTSNLFIHSTIIYLMSAADDTNVKYDIDLDL